jgi:hypothetical protein
MSGAGKGDIEFVIAVIGFLITAVLVAITIAMAVAKRGGVGRWFTGSAAALVVTVGLLTYI